MCAQARERPLVEKARQIVRAVRQEFTASQPDKQVEILALDACNIRPACCLGERGMRQSKRGCIAAQPRESLDECCGGSTRKQEREERVFLRPCNVDII